CVLDGERQARLVGPDRLVLCAVVLEQPLRVLRPRHQREPADEDRDPEHPVHQVEEQALQARVAPQELEQPQGEEMGRGDEQPHHEQEGHAEQEPAGELTGRLRLVHCRRRGGTGRLRGLGLLGAEGERGEAVPHRLDEHHRAPEEGLPEEGGLRPERLPDLLPDGDLPVGTAHRDDQASRRAHHHALQDRLPTDVRTLAHLGWRSYALAFGAFLAGAAAAGFDSYFFRNRSTRPSVSTSLYLPVKKGWQAEQISTWNEPRVERVSITLPQAQVMREGG